MPNKIYYEWTKSLIKKAFQTKTPVVMMFELTSRCNFDCKMCYVHNIDAKEVIPRELTTDQWIQIMDEAYEQGMLFAYLTGGECLLRHDFRELYLHLWKKGVRVSVFTNGSLLDDDYISFFSTYPPELIQISLYGSSNKYYEQVTGRRAYDTVIEALENLKRTNIQFRIAVTPSRYMTDDYKRIIHYCVDNGFELANIELYLFPNRDDLGKTDYLLEIPEIVELEKERRLLRHTLTPLCDLPAPGGGRDSAPEGTGCNAGNCRAFISWDGLMSPCVNLLLCRVPVLTLGFKNAWKKVVEAAMIMKNPVECEQCAYRRICFHCPTMRMSVLQEGHCNPNTCALTVEKCKAGIFNRL